MRIVMMTKEPDGTVKGNTFGSINEVLRMYNSEDEEFLPSDGAEVLSCYFSNVKVEFNTFLDVINYLRKTKQSYANVPDWIPVEELYPDDGETVQVTFQEYGSNPPKYRCDQFVYKKKGKWFYAYSTDEVGVKIVAWKRCCPPYIPKD